MSTAKRSKRRQPEAKSASPPPASKRLKTTKDAHVPAARSGLGFLVDEDARHGKKLEARLTNGVPGTKTSRLDESRAVIAPDSRDEADAVGGTEDTAIDISSAEESSSEDDDDDDDDDDENESRPRSGVSAKAGGQAELVNGHASGVDHESEDDAVAEAEDAEMEEAGEEEDPAEPSFGDILKARHPQAIDVQAAFPNPMADRQALVPASGDRVLAAPSGTSLGTVLTQALKTNDKDLLESCFQTTDLPSIRATVQRLQSQHVATLLQRLAERIHKRPGRTGNLMVWVQWSLVAHGGYLSTQPDLVKKLKSLVQVIRDRANGLQPLLHLKGKLDMLSAQLELRRNMQAASRAANADDEDNEEGVVYVEGRDDDWSDSDADAADVDLDLDSKMIEQSSSGSKAGKNISQVGASDDEDESDSGSDESMPNGVAHEDEESSAEDDEPGMFDIEAEETDDDDDDEEEEEEDSEDEGDSEADSGSDPDLSDDDSEASGVKQPKATILNRKR